MNFDTQTQSPAAPLDVEAIRRHFPALHDGVTMFSRARRRTPTLLATFAGVQSSAVSEFLAQQGVNAPASSFYGYETSELLGLGEAGGVRIGLAPYNNDRDVARLLDALNAFFSRATG
ncbi:hypothetical protein [Yimella lutea]|uniref:hypothetical protein n=1 Tax=Yimella lutea TaxID=587872 RepID=UPI0011546C49|nr:hypothetical protein [Yimella lutea]